MTKTKPVRVTPKQLREAAQEIAEYRQMNANARADLKQLEDTNERLNHGRLTLVESLMQERVDLIARIARIDQRVNALVGVAAASLQYNVITGHYDGPGDRNGMTMATDSGPRR